MASTTGASCIIIGSKSPAILEYVLVFSCESVSLKSKLMVCPTVALNVVDDGLIRKVLKPLKRVDDAKLAP